MTEDLHFVGFYLSLCPATRYHLRALGDFMFKNYAHAYLFEASIHKDAESYIRYVNDELLP